MLTLSALQRFLAGGLEVPRYGLGGRSRSPRPGIGARQRAEIGKGQVAPGPPRGWDVMATVAVGVTALVAAVYVALIAREDGHLAAWFLAGLAVAAALGIYGAGRSAPRRGIALLVCGATLLGLGLLAILSIGLPLLVAGILALVAAARAGPLTR
jgi:hypothetical protein